MRISSKFHVSLFVKDKFCKIMLKVRCQFEPIRNLQVKLDYSRARKGFSRDGYSRSGDKFSLFRDDSGVYEQA